MKDPQSPPGVQLALGVALGVLGALFGMQLREHWSSSPADLDERRFGQVRALVEETFIQELAPGQLLDGALEGMLTGLDPYSDFYDREESRALERETAGVYRGIGVSFMPGPTPWQVLFALPGSPAERAGLKLGDRFAQVDGIPTESWTAADLRGRLSNTEGETVRLELESMDGALREVELTPGEVLDPSVRHAQILEGTGGLQGGGIAYLAIGSFSRRTPEEFDATWRSLEKEAPTALVLDLRGNLGGVLGAATHIADRVLTEGSIVETRTRHERKPVLAELDGSWLSGLPMVCLVDRDTASSSEVLAGALQDHRAAMLIGEPTFGKGTVQTLTRLPGELGIVKLTTALYLLPSGRAIERSLEGAWNSGLEPDVLVDVDDSGRAAIREFLNGFTPPIEQMEALRKFEAERGQNLIARPEPDSDPALAAALAVLRGEHPGPRQLAPPQEG